jgi:cytosine/adenosine deaminase-related metal-dependent hydrolase
MSLEAALTKHKQFHGNFNNRLHVWMAAETPRGIDESFYAEVGETHQKHNIGLTVHVAETARDQELIRKSYNTTPVQFCEKTKLSGERTVLAHMIHLDLDTDLDILQRTNTSVVHNPTSNCKLADGIAPIPQMLAKGINVALGTDGAPCSNTYDLFRDMHLAGIIHKGVTRNASVLPAEQVLEMATINGAKALGLEEEIGSLEVGKKADFVVINAKGLHAAPYAPFQEAGGVHPVTIVVHSCGGSDVEMVVVDGVVVVENGVLLSADEEDIKHRAREAASKIRMRSGIQAQPPKMGWRYV